MSIYPLPEQTVHPLHEQTLFFVKEERRLTGLVIENLQKIFDERLHLKMGYSSLFEYATKGLGYSESCAYRRISAVRISKELPEIKEKLNDGTLTLTTLTMAQTLFRKENLAVETKRSIIEKIENKSKLETQKILSAYSKEDLFKQKEKVTILSENKARIQITVTQELISKLEKIKHLRSHKNPSMTYEDLLSDMSDYMLKKLDPGLRNNNPGLRNNKTPSGPSLSKNIRYISANLKSQIWKRDLGECQFTHHKTGHKCKSKHLIEIDHIQPVSAGGNSAPGNLRLICKAHNLFRNK